MMIGKMFGKSPDVEDFNGIDLKEKERWEMHQIFSFRGHLAKRKVM